MNFINHINISMLNYHLFFFLIYVICNIKNLKSKISFNVIFNIKYLYNFFKLIRNLIYQSSNQFYYKFNLLVLSINLINIFISIFT